MDFEMQVIYCPICGKEHECEFHDEYVYTTLHDVPIRYRKQFYRCPIAFKMNDEEYKIYQHENMLKDRI